MFEVPSREERLAQLRDPIIGIAFPFWKFMTVGDGRVCALCRSLDYFVAPWNDPAWDTLFPPFDDHCRCIVVAIGPDEAPPGSDVPAIDRLPKAARSLFKEEL